MKTIGGKTAQIITLNWPDGTSRPFYHRGSRADQGVLAEIFRNAQYSFSHLKRRDDLMAQFHRIEKPMIIDGGANIGASAVWFAINYPRAHVVAFEPDPENFELLSANTAGLDVDARKAAIGGVDGKVSITDPGEGEWGYRTALDATGGCDMFSIAGVIERKMAEGYTPFIVKVDIEGGEDGLFQEPTDWVDMTPLIIVELHDWLMPKQGTSRNFLKCVAKYDRDFLCFSQNIFSLKN
jgi:FkbM family methyltransferase